MATILIVDDLSVNRVVLTLLLRSQGHRLLEAADGGAGLATARAEHPDLVITDVLMPVMDGYQLVKELRLDPVTRNIPVVFYTAHYGESEARALARSSGVAYVLTKPADPDEVLRIVGHVLGGQADFVTPPDSAPLTDAFDREHLRLLTDKLSEKAGYLRTANARLRALVNIGLDLASERDSGRLLQSVCASACDLFGATYVTVGILDRDHETVEHFCIAGAVADDWIKPGDPASGILKAVVTERRTVRHDNPDGAAAALDLPLNHPEVRAFLAAPVASPAHAYGWICLVGNEGRSFTADDEALLMALSGQIGRIYENVYLSEMTQKRAEDLQLLTERLSLATAVAGVGVWEWDLATNTMTLDPTMCRIYGFPPVVLMPYSEWAAAVHREDLSTIEATLQQAIADRKGSAKAVEFRIVLPNGTVRTVSAVQGVVLDRLASVRRVVGVNMDITERKEAEAAAEHRRTEELRFKDEFLSHVSHELRTPLTVVKQFTSILLGGLAGSLNKEQHDYQEIVLKNVCQLQSMIGDILEVTRLESGKLGVELESLSIATAVVDTMNSFALTARAKGVTLSSHVPPGLPLVHADQTRLQQILIILVDNAIKFTPEGGAVSIQAQWFAADSRFLRLDVTDTGCGVSAELAERIFERLYQAPDPTEATRKGLGLGLYICKQLVTRQGGRIWITPRPQQGSTFSFTLPVSSLNHVIAPLLTDDKWPAETVALVAVEACSLPAWSSSAAHDDWCKEAHDLIKRCLSPVPGAILPTRRCEEARELFFVAAFTDQKGASSLVNRIQTQFERSPSLRRSGATLSVTSRMLSSTPPDADAAVEQVVSCLADTLGEAITTVIGSEAVLR